jgi:hypothetical protein
LNHVIGGLQCILLYILLFIFVLCTETYRIIYGNQLMYSLHDHRAVLDHSVGKELPVVAVESFECLPGRGVAATLSGVKVRLTSIIFFNQQSHLELSDISKTLL